MSTQGQEDVVGPPNTRFVSKPVEIEAHRIGIDPWPDAAWEAVTRNEIRLYDCAKPDGYIIVRTLEGEMRGNHGDWLIRGTEGEFYPCKPSVFERKYEARTLLSSSRGEQGPLAIALRTLSLIAEGHEKRMPDGTTEVWDVEDAAEVAKSAIAAVQSLTAAPSAPGSVPTSLAGQGTDTCTCDEFQSCPRCHTANLDPDWLEKELAEVATQPTAGGDAPTFDTPKSEPNLEPSNVFSNALSAERARVIEECAKVAETFHEDDDGIDRQVKRHVAAALRALGQQDTGEQ